MVLDNLNAYDEYLTILDHLNVYDEDVYSEYLNA